MSVKVNITSPTLANGAIVNHTIEPGAIMKIWEDEDFDDDSYAYNREKFRNEVTGFRIESILKNGVLIKTNPNNTQGWDYERKQKNKATYTFTLEETDF